MSTSNDPVLDFLTRWLLGFGEGFASLGQVANTDWYWSRPIGISHLEHNSPPLLEPMDDGRRIYRITQAGLDYVARGGDHAGE